MRARLARAAGAAVRLTARAAPGQLALHAVVTVLAAILPVATAWLTKLVLDATARHEGTLARLLGLVAGLAATGLVAAALPQVAQYLRATLQRAVARTALDRLYTAVNRLVGLRELEDPAFLDRLRLAQQAAGETPARVLEYGFSFGQATLTLIGLLVALVTVSPLMAGVVVLAGLPTLLAELALSGRRVRTMWDVAPFERRELFYGMLLTSAAAAREIRLFGAGRFLVGRMLTERRGADDARQRLERRELAVQASLELVGAAVAGAALVRAVAGAWTGSLSVGDIAILVAGVAGVQAALTALVTAVANGHQQLLLLDHYLSILDSAPAVPAVAAAPPAPLADGIELRDVWFRYGPGLPWVLRGVTLTLRAGTATALVGRNGAGKSTLIKLLCRFYEPTRGAIRWDGRDLADIPADELRARIGAVFQDFMEYDLTVAENIGIGDVGAGFDRHAIEAAARRAGAHKQVAALPRGYDTMLSRVFFTEQDKDDPVTGMTLSGGQWQRLAVARALLRADPDLLILDEPSSGLDAEAEHDVHARLRRHRAGRTSLLVSHRLAAVRDADLIVVLDDGAVAETGSHDALLDADGIYAGLFRRQAEGYLIS